MFPKDAILSASAFVGKILLVSNDAIAIEQLTDSLQELALFWELLFSSSDVSPHLLERDSTLIPFMLRA